MAENSNSQPETQAIHTGVYKDSQYHSVSTPLYLTSLFEFESLEEAQGYNYGRFGNPTRTALEENLSALEGGAGATATASGMAAIHMAFLALNPGDHIIIHSEIFGGTLALLRKVLDRQNYKYSQVDLRDLEAVKAAIVPSTRMIWIETPSNPLATVLDIEKLSEIAKKVGALTVVDNSFLGPVGQKPLELGADIVVYSTSKFINGHSDVISGAVIAKSPDLAHEIQQLANTTGVTGSPFDCWQVLRGLKTLPLRMRGHEENAQGVVEFLKDHEAINQIYYPGLKDHPGHELAKQQQKLFGGVMSVELAESIDINLFLKELKLFKLGYSFGGVESIISHPWSMSHKAMTEAEKKAAGISKRLFRLSVGLEHTKDQIKDLQSALEHAQVACV